MNALMARLKARPSAVSNPCPRLADGLQNERTIRSAASASGVSGGGGQGGANRRRRRQAIWIIEDSGTSSFRFIDQPCPGGDSKFRVGPKFQFANGATFWYPIQ